MRIMTLLALATLSPLIMFSNHALALQPTAADDAVLVAGPSASVIAYRRVVVGPRRTVVASRGVMSPRRTVVASRGRRGTAVARRVGPRRF